MIELGEADVVRRIYRLLVEEHRSCRQMTKHLNESHTPTPSGLTQVWHPATVRTLLTNRVYAGQARDHYRQPATPRYRKRDVAQLHSLATGRRYRPPSEWVWSDAPAMISAELFDKAQVPMATQRCTGPQDVSAHLPPLFAAATRDVWGVWVGNGLQPATERL